MTRINVIKPIFLADQHLLPEHRELPRVFSYARAAAERGDTARPAAYTMGTGHMRFFYNKTAWLAERHRKLTIECLRRGFKVQQGSLTPLAHSEAWEPTERDIRINLERLQAKLAAPPRPDFYKRYGVTIGPDWYNIEPWRLLPVRLSSRLRFAAAENPDVVLADYVVSA